MPNFQALTPEAVQDMRDSAVLDTIFPAFLSAYPGRVRDAGFDGVAVFFTSVNQVTRYYPPVGLHAIARPDSDLAPLLTRMGPEQNPQRLTTWTAPYLDNAGQGLVLTAHTPVYQGNLYRGVVGVDLSLAKLVDEINLVAPTPGSVAFYVDKEGKLLPSKSFNTISEALARPEGTQLAATMNAMRRGERGVARLSFDGRDSFLAYAPLAGVGGSFAVVSPLEELTSQAAAITGSIEDEGSRTVMVSLLAMGWLFIIGLAAATALNRQVLLKPIQALVEGTRAVAGGDLDTRLDVAGDDEMSALARSFNQMTADIQSRSAALEREVRERRQAQDELRALFAAMTDYVLVVDKDGRFLRMQSTNTPDLLAPPEELVGRSMFEVMPRSQADAFLAPIREALAAGDTRTVEYPMEVDGTTYWFSSAISPISRDAVLIVARDITERVVAGQELEREVAERRRAQDELRALFAAMTDVVVVLDREGRVLRLAPTNPGALHAPRGDIVGKTLADMVPAEQAERSLRAIAQALDSGTTQTIEYPVEFDSTLTWLSAAISPMSRDSVVYVARDITERMEASQKLELQVAARTRELSTILEITKNVASTLELRPLLQLVLTQLKAIVDYSRASIFLQEGDEIVLLDSRQSAEAGGPLSLRIPIPVVQGMWDRIREGGAYIIDDVRGDTPAAEAYRAAVGGLYETAFRGIHSWMGVPLALKDRLLGLLTVSHTQPGYYTEVHAALVGAIASQAAIAIENARLYEQAQQLAAVEERQRLARELHDSVSQALYGIALGARTARTLLDRDPARAVEPVDYVLSLAEAGLAEMRALIFELRPESLEIEGLVAALDKQIAATSARYNIAVDSALGDEPSLSLADKEVFYRIGQEALHNIVKHSRATQASVRLAASNGDVMMEIADNGVGFEAGQSFPGHIGLVSMAERAASIGARLDVESAPGKGTMVRVSRHVSSGA
jgi:PAS domain S-box-containing protein